MGVQSTVVFTDLHGSTAVFEAMGNQLATELVTELTGAIAATCIEQGGRVVKTLGDGVMVLFSDAGQALAAVVALQRAHARRMDLAPHFRMMPVRVGLSTGEVELVSGDCYGDAVNVAARLCDLCGPNEIWATTASLEADVVPAGVDVRMLGLIHVRGRAEPCSVAQIEWREEEPTDVLTMQGFVDPGLAGGEVDALGSEIELSQPGMTRRFKSFELPVHIGRITNLDFPVNDPRVSRTHARLDWHNGCVVLVDLSSFGTWVRFDGASGPDIALRRSDCVLHGQGELALGAPFGDGGVPTLQFRVW